MEKFDIQIFVYRLSYLEELVSKYSNNADNILGSNEK